MPTRPLGPCRVPSCPNRAVRYGRCAEHKDYGRERPTFTQRGYGVRWAKIRDEYLANHPHCQCTDEEAIKTHETWGYVAVDVHHVRAKALGGTDDWTNLVGLCHRCHTRIHKTMVER